MGRLSVANFGARTEDEQREGLKPEGVETWNKARCEARKPVPGMAGASIAIWSWVKCLTVLIMNDYQNIVFWN